MEQYSTNLTDKQWQFIEKIVNTQKRRRKYSVVKLLYISYRYLIFQFFISLFPQLITVKNILPHIIYTTAYKPDYQKKSHLLLTVGNKIVTKKRRNSLSGGLLMQR